MQQMDGKRLLIVGIYDDRKNVVYDIAARFGITVYSGINIYSGIKCCSTGTYQLPQDKVVKHIWYDTYCHESDQKHCDTIVELVRSEFGEVDGCITFWDDCIPLTALLCQHFGTPGLPYSGAVAANKKSLTFEELKTTTGTLGNAVKEYLSLCYNVASLTDLEKSSEVIGFPAVLKNEYGGGGVSFRIVQDMVQCRDHLSFLQSACVNETCTNIEMGKGYGNECVLMELLEGSEHAVDLVVFHGELLCAFLRDKGTRSAQDITAHTMSVMPSLLTVEKQKQVVTAAFECCLALGLDHGIIDVDIMLTESGPKLIEINARMGGMCQRDFAQVVYNVDLIHLAFQLACDVRPVIPLSHSFMPLSGISPSGAQLVHSECSSSHISCLNDSQDLPPVFAPEPSCVIVGRTLYGWQHGSALRTTARHEVFQQLHHEGKLLFFPHDVKLREQRHNLPFCTFAVTGDTFSDATGKMERLCRDLGLEPMQMSK
ncbi:hypothetical protein ACOMHN_017867 [Nucella lapillus]